MRVINDFEDEVVFWKRFRWRMIFMKVYVLGVGFRGRGMGSDGGLEGLGIDIS